MDHWSSYGSRISWRRDIGTFMKTCTRCHQTKSLENFRIRKRSDAKSNGLNATCRTCDAQLAEEYRNRKRTENQTNKVSWNQQLRLWRQWVRVQYGS